MEEYKRNINEVKRKTKELRVAEKRKRDEEAAEVSAQGMRKFGPSAKRPSRSWRNFEHLKEPMDTTSDGEGTDEASAGISQRLNALAVLVGVGKYGNDARRVRKVLLHNGFHTDNIVLLTDEYAIKTSIHYWIDQASHHANKDSLFLFYFSGHGTPLPHPSLKLEMDPNLDGVSEYPVRELRRILSQTSQCFSKTVSIMDCCHAETTGPVSTTRSKGGVATADEATFLKQLAEGACYTQWSACRSEQSAAGHADGHSRFTRYLVAALMGGKPDECPIRPQCDGCRQLVHSASFKGLINTYDVQAYIAYHCSQDDLSGQPMQTPVFAGHDTGPFPIALFRPAT